MSVTLPPPAPTGHAAGMSGRRRWRWPALPRACELCGTWGSRSICSDCVSRFGAPRPRCPRCALPCPGAQVCGDCLRRPPVQDRTVAAVDYAFPWDRLVSRLKYRGQPELAACLAEQLAERLAEAMAADTTLSADTLLVPMPSSAQRLRERGFNQAWELARHLGARLGLATEALALRRWRDTPHQVGLTRSARDANLRDALWVPPDAASRLRGGCVAVVDDVMTTGASASAAAHALRQAGVAQVQVWVLARAPRPD